MKKIIALLIICCFCLGACADTKIIDGIEYETHGLFNEDTNKNPEIKYRLVWGNVIWGAILCETIIAPIYFYGFSLWEPVGKNEDFIQGQVAK